jgi:hypothetical protein
MLARFRPRPTFANVVALLALFVALGGGALAASKFVGSDGRIHGCVTSKGKLTLVKSGTSCKKGKAIAWNQRGPRGRAGRNAAAAVTVRAATMTFHYSSANCTNSTGFFCTSSQSTTVPCNQGERAVGGGYGKTDDASLTIHETKPAPTSGTPTGWTISGDTVKQSPDDSPPDTNVPVHAVCVAP